MMASFNECMIMVNDSSWFTIMSCVVFYASHYYNASAEHIQQTTVQNEFFVSWIYWPCFVRVWIACKESAEGLLKEKEYHLSTRFIVHDSILQVIRPFNWKEACSLSWEIWVGYSIDRSFEWRVEKCLVISDNLVKMPCYNGNCASGTYRNE